MSELLAAALEYAAAGIYVLPVHVTIADDGKKKADPIGRWREVSTIDPATINKWWSRGSWWVDASLAIDCGKSHLVVLDPDGVDGLKAWAELVDTHSLPATFRAATPGGGEHWYYAENPRRVVGNDSSGKVADHVDVRGMGGFVFAPPSTDIRGAYRWREGVPEWGSLPTVPDLVADRMNDKKAEDRKPEPVTEPDPFTSPSRSFTPEQAWQFAAPALDALQNAKDGQINHRLNDAAIMLNHFVPAFLTRAEAEQKLGDALVHTVYDGRTWKAENTIASGLDARTWKAEKVPAVPAPVGTSTAAADDQTASPSAEALPTRRVRLTSAASIKPKPTHWLWQDRLPVGELCLFAGRGGIGKSTALAWFTAQLTQGTLDGALKGHPASVAISAAEDSWERTIVPRLIAAGADLERVFRVDVCVEDFEGLSLSLPADNAMLGEAVKEHDIKMLILDPLMSVMSGKLDSHKDAEVRQALEPLVRLAQTGVTVIGNAHLRKSSADDVLSMVMGSAAFGNVVRAAIGLARDVITGQCVLSQVKNNLGRLDVPHLAYEIQSAHVDIGDDEFGLGASVGKFVILGESELGANDLLNSDKGSRDDDQNEIEAWLRSELADGPVKSADIYRAADAAGYSRDQAKRAKKKIGVLAVHPDITGPWFWELPQGSAQGSKGVGDDDGAPLAPLSAPLGVTVEDIV